MALVLLDRAKETTTVVGTGTATLLGAVTSYQSLAGVGNGNTTYYCIVDQVGANWEVGIGTYTASGTTLARTTVLASSNGGALVVFTAGVKDVFVTYPSEKGVWYDASGNVLFTGTTTATNLAYTGTLTGSTGILNIGSGQLYKDASGNVGIGTSSPSSKLDITWTTNAGIRLSDGTVTGVIYNTSGNSMGIGVVTNHPMVLYTNNAERMRIDSSGNMGIGTSNPDSNYKLEVIQSANTKFAAKFRINDPHTTAGFNYGVMLQNNDATVNNYTTLSNMDSTGVSNAWIEFTNVAHSAVTPQGAIGFNTRNGSNYARKMTIDMDGNVGIGTSSPAGAKLRLNQPSGVYGASTPLQSWAYANIQVINLQNDGTLNPVWNTDPDSTWSPTATMIWQYRGSEKMRIDSSGNLLVGTTAFPSSSSKMLVSGDLNATYTNGVIQGQSKTAGDVSYPALYLSKFDNNSTTSQVLVRFAIGNYAAGQGQINGNGANAVAFGSFSDRRLKENIANLPSQLNNILALRPVEFDYIASEGGGHQIGFIAQEVKEIYPDLVGEREDGMLTLSDMNKNDARLIKAIQELKAIIDTQQEQINSLLGK